MIEHASYETRQDAVRRILEDYPLDAILFSSLENIRYLCGFTGSDGVFLLTRKEGYFLTDSRYWTQAEEEVKGSKIVHYRKKTEGIITLFSDKGLGRIGFESSSLTFSLYRALAKDLTNGKELVPLEKELKNLRAIKDSGELVLTKDAINLASKAFEHILGKIKEGVVEREIALEMEFFMKNSGAQDLGFDIIMASGKRSALPHGKAGLKRIEKGDFILIDFGSMFQGYHSDQTRTVICGSPSPEQQKIYQIVKEAQEKAIEAVRPGVSFEEVDAAARDHIRGKGFDEYFGHGLGHGIGLAVHEDPVVNRDNKDPLEEGMIFTIEPGIYLPGWGGVRIEDMVRVGPRGAELLSYLPRELKVV